MKIALIQHDIVWEDAAATRTRVRPLLERAADAGAALAVLPEMFAVGFSMDAARIAEPEEGPTAAWLGDRAAALGLALVAGVPVATGDRFENHALVFDARGRRVARYAKIHPFTFAGEHEHYAAGSEPVVCSIAGFVVGLGICYDLRFPELYRRLAGSGAELLITIANWPRARAHHWSRLLRARAIENVALVVGVNRTGSGGGLDYPGASAVVDPTGRTLVEGDDREAVLLAEIEARRVHRARLEFPFLNDVRKDLFPGVFGEE